RPGQAPDGSMLLPLEKSKPGPGSADDPREFALEIVYLTPGLKWNDKGKASIALPRLDLPVSRTGLQVYYPPLFRVSSEPGIFHTDTDAEPFSPVLSATGRGLALLEPMGRADRLGIGAAGGMSLPSGVPMPPPPPGASGLADNSRSATAPQTVSPD